MGPIRRLHRPRGGGIAALALVWGVGCGGSEPGPPPDEAPAVVAQPVSERGAAPIEDEVRAANEAEGTSPSPAVEPAPPMDPAELEAEIERALVVLLEPTDPGCIPDAEAMEARGAAHRRLRALGPPVVPALVARLDTEDGRSRQLLLRMLPRLGGGDAVVERARSGDEEAFEVLLSPHTRPLPDAADSLALGSEPAGPSAARSRCALLGRIAEDGSRATDARVRAIDRLLEIIGQTGDRGVKDAALGALRPVPGRVTQALAALDRASREPVPSDGALAGVSHFRGAGSVPVAMRYLDHPDAARRSEAATLLSELGPPARPALPQADVLLGRDDAGDVIAGARIRIAVVPGRASRVVERLVWAYEHGELEHRIDASQLLRQAAGPEDLPALEALQSRTGGDIHLRGTIRHVRAGER